VRYFLNIPIRADKSSDAIFKKNDDLILTIDCFWFRRGKVETDRQTDGRTDRQTERQAGRKTNKQTNRQTDKLTSRQTDKLADKQTNRQTDKQTN
jgi:hypothetical protein